MNTYQALRILNVDPKSSQDEIRSSYRKMALELHPDKNSGDDTEFKKVTEAYNHLKKNHFGTSQYTESSHTQHTKEKDHSSTMAQNGVKDPTMQGGGAYEYKQETSNTYTKKDRFRWGAGPQDGTVPEQDWSKFTKSVEEDDPDFWKEYEKKFWEDYNARIRSDGSGGEYEKASEPERQPNIFVDVDKSLCIGCCSCEIIAPDVFEINKSSMLNPKSSVINQKGAGINKIMNAAETCPTKAIKVENTDTKERLFPY